MSTERRADQRYYASTYGRFITVDPDPGSANATDSGSWNRYSYVRGDPVNYRDRTGAYPCIVGVGEGAEWTDCEDETTYVGSYGPGYYYACMMGFIPGCQQQLQTTLPSSPAAGTGVGNLKNYNKALKSLKKFGTKDPDCLTDLKAVGLTPSQVSKLATGAQFTSYVNATPAQGWQRCR